MNIGEEICGEWLRHVCRCEFVQYNLKTPDLQGEIDVIDINLAKQTVYACEVAGHLVTGLQYVKDNHPDNVPRLTAKFRKDVEYVRKASPKYGHVFMLWAPVVKNQRAGAMCNQAEALCTYSWRRNTSVPGRALGHIGRGNTEAWSTFT